MKGVVYKACARSVSMYGTETWAMKAGVFLEAVSHREENVLNDLQSDVEGYD